LLPSFVNKTGGLCFAHAIIPFLTKKDPTQQERKKERGGRKATRPPSPVKAF
jgi:hypothetical protein